MSECVAPCGFPDTGLSQFVDRLAAAVHPCGDSAALEEKTQKKSEDNSEDNDESWRKALECLLEFKLPPTEIAKKISQYFGVDRKRVYKTALEISKK